MENAYKFSLNFDDYGVRGIFVTGREYPEDDEQISSFKELTYFGKRSGKFFSSDVEAGKSFPLVECLVRRGVESLLRLHEQWPEEIKECY